MVRRNMRVRISQRMTFAPLVQLQRQVAIGLHPFREIDSPMIVSDGRANDDQRLLQLRRRRGN